jgi:hypothetical protein
MALNIPSAPRPLGNNMPKISKIGVPTNIGRATNTSTSQIIQKTDRANARVSMNQVLSAKAEARGEKTTSINRVGSMGNVAKTSVARYATNIKTSVNDAVGYNQDINREVSEEKRHDYVQQLMAKRKLKAAEILRKRLKG